MVYWLTSLPASTWEYRSVVVEGRAVFEFQDLDRMGRAMLLAEQKKAVDYWRAVHRLIGLFIGYGVQTNEVMAAYRLAGGQGTIVTDLARVQLRGEMTLRKLRNERERIDAYLRDLDVRLADGSKWYTAQEIADMTAIEGEYTDKPTI